MINALVQQLRGSAYLSIGVMIERRLVQFAAKVLVGGDLSDDSLSVARFL